MTAMILKEQLLKHLKTQSIAGIDDLWCHTKYYYKNKGIEMGGAYASIGEKITVRLLINKTKIRFEVYIYEAINA